MNFKQLTILYYVLSLIGGFFLAGLGFASITLGVGIVETVLICLLITFLFIGAGMALGARTVKKLNE